MDKTFDPASYEQKWQRWWSEHGFFTAEAPSAKPPFCVMIPPPNVTGRLHMGHALQSTLQDLLTRWHRMRGFNALWLPGTDHAGIATQLMVERQLESEGTSRAELGREAFLERTWAWKENYQGNIRRQLDALGASCDWTRERFTLDEGLSAAVAEAFVRLYEEGLIYRGEYMVNWSPGLDTAISDLEVEMRPVAGKLYHVAYPVAGEERRIVVATTRPETMLGDTAVAYHPDDERYRDLATRHAILPLVGRELPFVADEAVEPGFGTGLVKVTPAHDPTDFEIGRRHGLASVQVIDRRGRMTAAAGEEWAGRDRFEAREEVVARLRAGGYLVAVEDYAHNVGHCQRSNVPIEPLVSMQWFCDVSGMAEKALAGAAGRRLELVPETWRKTWEHWLTNIRPWCISRQLWWGHRIPAWYTPAGELVVARDRAAAERLAGSAELERDPDVLDTWFSSALWPFSTLGWPAATRDLATFYPTNVLVTGHDILFFWVARMVMTGIHFTGELPFRTVHLTGLVRDADGQKMSKTRGNTVDPMELVAEYGADALRFTLAALDSPGRDIPLDTERMAGYRAFGNKIWNAVRFSVSRTSGASVEPDLDPAGLAPPERWILSRLARVEIEVNERFGSYRFDEACRALYGFFWGELCDWYIELAKPALLGEQPDRPRVATVLLTAIERSLRLLHPVMPFLTEELWQRLPGRERVHAATIALAPYPAGETAWLDDGVEREVAAFMDVIGWLRNRRAELGTKPRDPVEVVLACADGDLAAFLGLQAPLARALAAASRWEVVEELPQRGAAAGASRDRVGGVDLVLRVPGRDLAAEERARLDAELAEIEPQMARLTDLLANAGFVSKAPDQVVEKNRQRLAELARRREGIAESLDRLDL
ncbi:MAG: valine--tRNA ligase [Acidobacteriota bacterium]|nr:valine--tRNA ligase [Acidobacteriota bacterium]MDH3524657.1 valine--tRNA ligase [Acidobacteriota bacterium]